jgi:hypothetical protein
MCQPSKFQFKLPFLGCLIWLLAFNTLRPQDFILLRSGDKLNVQILGITKEAITFRHPNVPADSISALPIVALQQVKFANGLEQYFFLPNEDRLKITQVLLPKSTTEISMDTLLLRDGRIETGKVIDRRRFSLDIGTQLGKKAHTIRLSKIHCIRYAGGVKEIIWPLYSFGNPFFKSRGYDYLSPHYIGFHAGINLPVGAFAETDNQNPKSGFATAGLSLSFSGFFRLYNGWGLYFSGQRSSNPFNNGGLRQKLSDELESVGFLASSPVMQSEWINHTLLLGPSYCLQRGRFMGNLNLAFGLIFSQAPVNQINGIFQGIPVQLSFIRESNPSPAVSASMDLRYFFHRNLQGIASMHFVGAELNLGPIQEQVSSENPMAPPPTGVLIPLNSKAPFSQLTFQLGLLLSLSFFP